ncbi:hypothetical protein KC19_4G180200 [Ceratodon purpureus]|uniref:Uncharacterized protein n=1 Tax=Ceratodon purpureus TaxID=3225 RepID=A0A8T0IDF3_CERPU|nr:hypothetical protein KC19_4G180200 [Ceratodon purpureus]
MKLLANKRRQSSIDVPERVHMPVRFQLPHKRRPPRLRATEQNLLPAQFRIREQPYGIQCLHYNLLTRVIKHPSDQIKVTTPCNLQQNLHNRRPHHRMTLKLLRRALLQNHSQQLACHLPPPIQLPPHNLRRRQRPRLHTLALHHAPPLRRLRNRRRHRRRRTPRHRPVPAPLLRRRRRRLPRRAPLLRPTTPPRPWHPPTLPRPPQRNR